MADDLKRVGLVFKTDGAVDFKKSLQEINSSIQENRSAFKLAESQWDENTKAADKLKEKQKYLAEQTKDYSDKVKLLQEELKELENSEKRNENAISKKRNQINQAKMTLNNYKKGLSEVEDELKSGAYKIQEYTDKIDKFSDKAKGVGDNLSGVSTAAAGLLASAAAMVPATEEYRKIMGSLEVSSELAGYTAEQTKETYEHLFSVLGDDQSAATTTANLQALGLTQEQLREITNGTIGAWAKYGDSIPIDGLAESINETVKAGAVTGTFADVLNWAGTSEDGFNEKLEACATESERVNLVMQELANQGLVQAGEKWQENNKNLVDSNKASAEMKEQTAQLAETIAPLVAEVTEFIAGLLEGFNNLPKGMQVTIGVVLALIASLSSVFSVIGTVSSGISALVKVLGPATAGTLGFNAAWLASPITWIIIAVVALIAGIVLLYNKCEWFRDGLKAIGEWIANFFTKTIPEAVRTVLDWIKENWQGLLLLLVNPFLGGFKLLYDNCEGFRNFIDGLIDGIGEKIKKVGKFFSGIGDDIKNLWKKIKNAIKTPHFKTTGKFSLSPLSVPSISVDWYAKGGILNSPTVFGMNGNRLMAGGEAGPEAVLPIELLRKYISEENQANNLLLAALIKEAIAELSIVAENNIYIGDKKLMNVLTDMVIKKISSGINDSRAVRGC